MIRRRELLVAAGATALIAVPGWAKRDEKEKEEEVPPTEDLMREHGVLRRLLLVYGEVAHRLDGSGEVKPEWLARSATIIREFIEDYHEKDEEEFIFPRMHKAGQHADLVQVLQAQHLDGRRVTEQIQKLTAARALGGGAERQRLAALLRSFMRMYEPHAAREDTVLFPAFRELIGERELDKLQEVFEQKEKALPHGGFEKMVSEVAEIERAVGVYDLAQFTPSGRDMLPP